MGKIWWLWLPLAIMAIQVVLEATFSPGVLSLMLSENGPHELFQFFVICAALIVSMATVRRLDIKKHRALAAWLGIALFGTFYISGEEISWGQHFMAWTTPEFWGTINDQDETNLHNTSSWLDQKPRILLEIGVVVGGLIIPALKKYRPALLPPRFAVIYPPATVTVTAGMFVLLKLSDTIAHHVLHVRFFERVSEVEELYLYYFVLIYMLEMRRRVLGLAPPAGI